MTSSGASIQTANTGSSSAGDTNIRVVIFSGKREDWENWREKFMVKAAMRNYEGVLMGDDDVPKTHGKDGKKLTLKNDEQLIADANKKGFGDLILSIDCSTSAGKVAFAMVKGTKTVENPGGNLRAAFLRLKAKFEPSTTPQLMQLTREFHSKYLGKNQDPDIFITDLEALKVKMNEMNHDITDKALILHVLNNLSEQYEMEVKMIEHKIELLKAENKEISIEEVRNELNLRYERLKKTTKSNNPTDYALYMELSSRVNAIGVERLDTSPLSAVSEFQKQIQTNRTMEGPTTHTRNRHGHLEVVLTVTTLKVCLLIRNARELSVPIANVKVMISRSVVRRHVMNQMERRTRSRIMLAWQEL